MKVEADIPGLYGKRKNLRYLFVCATFGADEFVVITAKATMQPCASMAKVSQGQAR